MPELVLACVTEEEPVEIDIARSEPAATIAGLEPANLERHAATPA
jgi:hypothetical protein